MIGVSLQYGFDRPRAQHATGYQVIADADVRKKLLGTGPRHWRCLWRKATPVRVVALFEAYSPEPAAP
jgi:hypothetical protein